MSLYRSKEKGDFSDRDIQALDVLKNHIAFRLYRDIFSDRQKGAKSKEERQAFLKQIASAHGLSDRKTGVGSKSELLAFLINLQK